MPTSVARQVAQWIAQQDAIDIVPWRDPLVESLGFAPDDPYAEAFWLPVVGPSALAIMRRFADWLARSPDGVRVPLAALGRSIGLGPSTEPSSSLVRTLARIADFGFATIDGEHYAVRLALPPLTQRQAARLPEYLRNAHAARFDVSGGGEACGCTGATPSAGSSSGMPGPPRPPVVSSTSSAQEPRDHWPALVVSATGRRRTT